MRKILHFTIFSFLPFWSIYSYGQQVSDTEYAFKVNNPAYKTGKGATIWLDEAHYNFHTLNGRYKPFANLLEKDGYVLVAQKEKFSKEVLNSIKILVIANALPDTGEWKLPTKSAIGKSEIENLNSWVYKGGSLFLIADHMPFPGAVYELAATFGFNFFNGFALKKDMTVEKFSRKDKNLTQNQITNGRSNQEKVDSVVFFTGQGFIPPKGAIPISLLNEDYKIYFPEIAWEIDEKTPWVSGVGLCNGAYMPYGKGRIVVFGEAALFTAQKTGEEKVGMNYPSAKQNQQLLLNIIHWLDHKF